MSWTRSSTPPRDVGQKLPELAALSPAVIEYLRRETAYIAQFNEKAARKVVLMIRTARKTLSQHPNVGVPGLIPGTRKMVVGPYVLTVRLRGGTPEIIDIRHGRQAEPKE
jgi:plasmid stabilization system protein ParE